MEFSVRVRLTGENDAGRLIRAFFNEFNPESSILIKGFEAILKIVFDTPPQAIVDALCQCEVIECCYGEIAENEIPFVHSHTEVALQEESETIFNGKYGAKKDNIKPQLDEIAKKAVSFEKFIDIIGLLLETGKRQDAFVNIVNAACNVKKITWKFIKAELDSKEMKYDDYFRIHGSELVCKKFNVHNISIMNFIKALVAYKEYKFAKKPDMVSKKEIPVIVAEPVSENELSDNMDDSITSGKKSVVIAEPFFEKEGQRMSCMPYIPKFEKVLEGIDKNQSVEERVIQVLNAMGLEKKTEEEQQLIFAMTDVAVRQERISYDIIFIKANIKLEDTMSAKKIVSKFINDFAAENGSKKKVKLLTFFKELQEIIMFKDELEEYMDFVN